MYDEKLIMFSFQHFQFTGIHAGIQSGHSWADMAVKYRYSATKAGNLFWDWATFHKTVVIKNGGDQEHLREIGKLFESQLELPWIRWDEDESCNGCTTAVSIVVPDTVYAFDECPYWLKRDFVSQLKPLLERPLSI